MQYISTEDMNVSEKQYKFDFIQYIFELLSYFKELPVQFNM